MRKGNNFENLFHSMSAVGDKGLLSYCPDNNFIPRSLSSSSGLT
jgi:hypothetical protein